MNISSQLQRPCLHKQTTAQGSLAVPRHGCWQRGHAPRALARVAAKKSATQERSGKEDEEEPQVASAALISGYEPVDSEGNPWWEPPERDFWEGGAWEWLGKGASIVLPTLLALSIAAGIYAAANYLRPEGSYPEPAPAASQPQGSEPNNLDFMLSGDNDALPAPF